MVSPNDTGLVVTPAGTVNVQLAPPLPEGFVMSHRVTTGVVTVVRLLSSTSAIPSPSVSSHACSSNSKASSPLSVPSPSTSVSTSFVTPSPSRSPAGLRVSASELDDIIDSSVPMPSVWLISTVYVLPIRSRSFASGVKVEDVAPSMAVPSAYHW